MPLALPSSTVISAPAATPVQPACTDVAAPVQRGLAPCEERPGRQVPKIAELPAEYRAKARERFEFVAEVLAQAERNRCGHELAVAAVAAREGGRWRALLSGGKEGQSALTLTNFRRWRRLVCAANGQPDPAKMELLADRYQHNGRPAAADSAAGAEFLQIFARLYETEQKLALRDAHRLAVGMALRAGLHPECILSVPQVEYHYKHKVDKASVMMARMGRDWAENHIAGYITRDWARIAVGEVWFGDHHVFDCPCKVDNGKGGWKAVRPWLTAWMDARSWYFAGLIIRADENPNSQAIEDALLQGIRANGNRPPKLLYTDNGKDYVSQGLVEPVVMPDGSQHSICQELGCLSRTALPYNARAKTIERAFKQVAQGFAKYWAGYLGNRPGNRPESAEHYWKNPEELPSLQQFCEAFAWWLENVYHATTGDNNKATEGRSPAAAWAAREPLRPALTDEELRLAFLKPLAQTRKIQRGGRLLVEGTEYQSRELWGRIGEEVMVKLDRFNGGTVHAFDFKGRHLCEVAEVRALPALGADRDELSAAMADNRRLLSHSRELHRERTGELKVVPVMDRLRLANPDITPEDVRLELERPEPKAAPRETEIRSSQEDMDLLENCLRGGQAPESPTGAKKVSDEDDDDQQLAKALLGL
jgi:transposase InsO family protein